MGSSVRKRHDGFMKMKATHSGSCQCCGAVQKLPAGVLAKHGYTTKWGFFTGTCAGSGSRPYEEAYDLIERFISNAETRKQGMQAFSERLTAPPAEGTTKAYYNVYRKGNMYKRAGYEWMEVELTFTVHTSSDSEWMSVQYTHPDSARLERLDLYSAIPHGTLDPLAFVAHLNAKRAAALVNDIAEIDRYIAWQEKRITEWKPAPLIPITEVA